MMEVKNQSQYIVTDWINYSTNDIFEVITDYVANGSFASLKNNVTYYNDKEYAILIRTKDFNNNFKDNFVYVDKKSYEFLNKSAIYFGDLIISNVGAIGTVFLAPNIDTPMTLGPNAILLRPRKEFHNQYLYFLFISQIGQSQLQKITTVTAQPKFNKTDFKKISIIIPPLNEQQKIAEILSTVDDQIEQTDQLIEKTKELKKGLMQQLMTKGIGNTEFKQSQLGEIPNEWKVKELGSLGEVIIGLTYSPKDLVKNSDDGILVLRSSNIRGNKLDFKDNKYVSSKISDKLLTKENDILICSRNGSRRLLGKSALIGSGNVGLTFGAFMSMYRSIYNTYLIHFFTTNLFKKQVYRNLGATINQITSSDLKQFKIALPPIEEQQKIAGILTSVDEKIEGYQEEKAKYEELKKGLMQQLLTGKTRVKVD